MTCSLKFKKSSMRSIARYRDSHTIVIYFKVPNDDDRQSKMHFSILLALLHAKTTMNEYIAMVSCTFSLIMIVIRR
jgi:hypothetical protein